MRYVLNVGLLTCISIHALRVEGDFVLSVMQIFL